MVQKAAVLVLAALLFGPALSSAFETPIPAVTVKPAFCDRVFSYVRFDSVWQDTPAARHDVMVPNVLLVYGEAESKEVVAAAARIAFYLGNWTEDIGFTAKGFAAGRMPPILVSEKDMPQTQPDSLIIIGQNNSWVRRHKISFEGPSVLAGKQDGKPLLFVGGETPEQTLSAIRYLADNRLNFKSGAYKTFFNFIRVRGYLEEENWAAAQGAIHSPTGLSACGRNMAIAGRIVGNLSDTIQKHIRHRNALLYEQLPVAVQEQNQEDARRAWKKAMTTCYGCHQGMGRIPRLRQYVPPESIHGRHQRIAQDFTALRQCSACHIGPTDVKGYEGPR